MARTRSQQETVSTGTPDTSKHWVHCMAQGKMRENALLWAGNRRDSFMEKYEEINRKNGKLFGHIDSDSILHIYAHGHNERIVIFQDNKELTPIDLLNFLKEESLSANHKFLELDACYSNKFAEQLAKIAKDDYPDLCITGFPEQFAVCQGNRNENLANLVKPFVIDIRGSDSIMSIIDENEFNKFPKDKKDEFIASKHEMRFYTNPQKESENETRAESATSSEEKKESNSQTFSTRITRSSAATMAYHPIEQDSSLISSQLSDLDLSPRQGYIIRNPSSSYQSTPRESIAGKRSWAEVVQRSTAEPTENNNNSVSVAPAEGKLSEPTLIEKELELVKKSQNNDTIVDDNSTPTNHFRPQL